MLSFIQFLNENLITERFINLLPEHEDEKRKHAQEVHDILQKAYAHIGGIHGTGFTSLEDMVKNLQFWKIHKKDGKIRAVSIYKDKGGRKMVACATDGTSEGKDGLARMTADDLNRERSYSEISGPMLKFTKRQVPDLANHVVPLHRVQGISGEEIRRPPEDDPDVLAHPELAQHMYQRKIGGDWHTKLMVGHTGNTIR